MKLTTSIETFFGKLVQPFRFIPESIADVMKSRRERINSVLLEAERLDRIRNPAKYRNR